MVHNIAAIFNFELALEKSYDRICTGGFIWILEIGKALHTELLTSVVFVLLLSTCMYVVCGDCPFVRLSLFSVPLEIYDLLF